jgi:hypothetical protein
MKLPTVPSQLIRLALKDLEEVEKNPSYKVYMSAWHQPQPEGPCLVCLAGAVMAQSLGVCSNNEYNPDDFEGHNRLAFMALNCFRLWEVAYGCSFLSLKTKIIIPYNEKISYKEFPEEFKMKMENLAQLLENEGN